MFADNLNISSFGAGPLSGVRVIELGQMVSAPYCARLFADLGADVVKVEMPEGDLARRIGPFPGENRHPEKSGFFFTHNTNKRGVTCRVDTHEGRDIFLQLLASADVLIENNHPHQMEAWCLNYDVIASVNPALVMISITPFGQTGPYSHWRGYDLNAYHLSGASWRYCGNPGEMPLQHGTYSADYFGAVTGAAWGMTALFGRDQIGGQQVDVSCAEAIAATFVGSANIAAVVQEGRADRRTGRGNALSAPATILPCRDGHVWMMVMESGQWAGLRQAMGDPAWAQSGIFDDTRVRAEHEDIVYPRVTEWCLEHNKLDIMELCQANGCPVSAILDIAEVADQPHLQARGYFADVEHAYLGTVPVMSVPLRFSQHSAKKPRPAPLLGQHNDEVWQQIGVSAHKVIQLREQGVL
jgi:crotonobetainyl-CoA:carnitine CoA-transferase CaiB-like acyl-CoA transferase